MYLKAPKGKKQQNRIEASYHLHGSQTPYKYSPNPAEGNARGEQSDHSVSWKRTVPRDTAEGACPQSSVHSNDPARAPEASR